MVFKPFFICDNEKTFTLHTRYRGTIAKLALTTTTIVIKTNLIGICTQINRYYANKNTAEDISRWNPLIQINEHHSNV